MPVMKHSRSSVCRRSDTIKGFGRAFLRMLVALSCLFFLSVINAFAGISLDGSFGTKGSLTGPNYLIPASVGQQAGSNVFQSFGTFSITAAESATFSGPAGIQNIISRVTGGQSSSINGTISSTINGANLYFINPAGVVFGPSATLDVSGSFHASTADYIKLADGGRFDAANPANSLLTSALPSAFGFLSESPKGISVNGSFLIVHEGKTISLVSGALSISDGNLFAPGGTINLISAASTGEAIFSGQNFNINTFSAMGQISIRETRSSSRLPVYDFSSNTMGNIDVSGRDSGGQIYIRGGQFVGAGGSINADTYGAGNAQGIDIELTKDMDVSASGVTSSTFGPGNAGKISITAGALSLSNAGTITSNAWPESTGDAGDITINTAGALSVSGYYDNGQGNVYQSGISSDTFGPGNAGKISITAGALSLSNAGVITSNAFPESTGGAGDITINAAGALSVSGYYANGQWNIYQSGIFSNTWSPGNAGKISITAGALSLSNAGAITTEAWPESTGGAGDITINTAGALSVSGYYDNGQWNVYQSGISSDTFGPGNAGKISITTGALSLSNAGVITSDAFPGSTGGAGDITINAAGALSVSGYYDNGQGNVYQSGIFSNTWSPGNAGNISITTGSLSLASAGAITTEAWPESTGGAGDITINAAGTLSVSGYYDNGQGNVYQSGISSDTFGPGNAGNISITAGALSLSNAGVITSDAFPGAGNSGGAGDITINAAGAISVSGYYVDGQENIYRSGIFSNTFGPGNAGKISIISPLLTIADKGGISTSTSSGGAGGNIGVNVTQMNLASDSYIASESTGTGVAGNIVIKAGGTVNMIDSSITTATDDADGGNISIDTRLMDTRNSSITSTVRGGTGNGGNIALNSIDVVLEGSSIIANAEMGNGGNLDINSGVFIRTADSVVSASSRFGLQGTVAISAPLVDLSGNLAVLSAAYIDTGALFPKPCAQREEDMSSFVVKGRDGVPPQPDSPLGNRFCPGDAPR